MRKLIPAFLLIFYANQTLVSQQSLCYTKTQVNQIRVQSDLNLSTLEIVDKVKFKTRKKTEQIQETIGESSEFEVVTLLSSHENFYPKWYSPPDRKVLNADGIKSFFITANPLLKKEWIGAYNSKNHLGEYREDKKSGERYFYAEHPSEIKQAYSKYYNAKTSLIDRFIFTAYTSDELVQFEKLGYRIYRTEELISLVKTGSEIYVNLKTKQISHHELTDYNQWTVSVKSYVYHPTLEEYIHQFTKTIIPKIFLTGECYESIEIVTYSDISMCSENREREEKTQKRVEALDLSISPNPSSDFVNVHIHEKHVFPVSVEIYNAAGQLMVMRKMREEQISIDIAEYQQGTYIIKARSRTGMHSETFVKI